MTLGKKAFENTVVKGENAGNQHFYPFQIMFSALSELSSFAPMSIVFLFLPAKVWNWKV